MENWKIFFIVAILLIASFWIGVFGGYNAGYKDFVTNSIEVCQMGCSNATFGEYGITNKTKRCWDYCYEIQEELKEMYSIK